MTDTTTKTAKAQALKAQSPGKQKTRELWLEQAVRAIETRVFKGTVYQMPADWKVTCGWAKGSTKFIGQCFPPSLSADGKTTQMFISPVLGTDVVQLLGTLLHEMGHAAVGCEHKHGKPFRDFVKAVGLVGKATATTVDPASPLAATLQSIADKLGAYPHPVLKDIKRKGKAAGGWERYQSVLIEGYKVVVSPKALEEWGAPRDPMGCPMVPDGAPERQLRALAKAFREATPAEVDEEREQFQDA